MYERDDRSSVRPFSSGYESPRIRRRRSIFPDPDEVDQQELLRSPQRDLLDSSESQLEKDNNCKRALSPRELRRSRISESTKKKFFKHVIDNDEIEIRDKCAMFNEVGPLSPILRTRNYRSRCFKPKEKDEKTIEKPQYPFDTFVVIFAFRFMSRNQRCLEYGKEAMQNHEIHMKMMKLIIINALRWMKDQNLLQKPTKDCDLPPIPTHSIEDLTVQTTSTIDYIAPKYLQIFANDLDKVTDLTSEYIHAHDKIDIQNDDDDMSVELNNLGAAESEIAKAMLEIDTEYAMKQSEGIAIGETSAQLQYIDPVTANDAFYNAVVAMAGDSTLDDVDDGASDWEGTESTFDVEKAKQMAMQVADQIQTQMPEKSTEKAAQAISQVQQKIINDIVNLSQNAEPQRTHEISIELQATVSSIGGYDFIEDKNPLNGIEKSYIDQSLVPATNEVTATGDYKTNETSQGTNASQDSSGRKQKATWKKLTVITKDIDQVSDDESSVGTEAPLTLESKYLQYEDIRESHDINHSIEVVLKDNFGLAMTYDIWEKATSQNASQTDENTTMVTKVASYIRENTNGTETADKIVEDSTWPLSRSTTKIESETNDQGISRTQSKFASFYASRPMMDASSAESPKSVTDYWKTLLTYDFDPDFDEEIESVPNDDRVEPTTDPIFEASIEENPSLGDSSAFSSIGSIPPTIQIMSSQSQGLSEITTPRGIRCEVKDYDPFHVARNTPLVVSEINS